MRTLSLIVALFTVTASAESPQAGSETPPQACADCLVLTPADVEQLKAEFTEIAQRAYRLGQQDIRQRCASLI